MKIIKARKIKKGEVVGIVAPSSSVDDSDKLEKGVEYFEKLGFSVEVGPNIQKVKGYLAGTDRERVNDIHKMFLNKKVKMIICLRGGYGAGRLLDKINYDIIKRNPKIFCGYSDITVLQNAFFKKAGLVTFAGPMAGVDFYNNISPFTEENFWRTVSSNERVLLNFPGKERLNSLRRGIAEGILIGGNLSLFTSLIGLEYLPGPGGKILMLEEVGEAPYRIDRMLNQIRLSGYFNKLSGVVLGRYTDCEEPDSSKKSLTLAEVMKEYFVKDFTGPVINNLSHGHLRDNLTIPIGIKVRVNGSENSLEFLENHLLND
jgi:muramoyltetrapeptide carboxypeptidase